MKRRAAITFLILASLLAGGEGLSFNVWWDEVHETITKKALQEARDSLNAEADRTFEKALLGDKGVRFPDIPEGLVKLALHLRKKGTLSHDSHYGEFQFWHSMAFPSAKTAEEVRTKILEQADEWYDLASAARRKGDQKTAGELMGRLVHMVQDSYSVAHVKRDDRGRITGFQDYNAQDAGEHSEADSPAQGNPYKYADLEKYLPGAAEAMAATRDLLAFFLSEQKPLFMARIESVYDVAPDAYPRKGSPRTEEQYKKK